MLRNSAISKRELFFKQSLPGKDDCKAPQFYADIGRLFPEVNNKNIAFIVVAHLVHSLPPFLEALSTLGCIAAIIPKQSTYVPEVVDRIKTIYSDEGIIKDSLKKEALQQSSAATNDLLTELFYGDRRLEACQFVIIDHGGYFAPQMEFLKKLGERLLGIVEHTWNGQKRYEEHAAPNGTYPFPVFSIARTQLKTFEDIPVAESIVSSIKGEVFTAKGLNQDATRSNIGVVGFGHLGKAIAEILKAGGHGAEFRIVDCAPAALERARQAGFSLVSSDLNELAQTSDLIVIATDAKAFTREILSTLKPGACLICVTSPDDLFTADALSDYSRDAIQNSTVVTQYKHISNGNTIYLASDGKSINFSIGSTANPIIHAVFAAVYVSALRLIQNPLPNMAIQMLTEADQASILATYTRSYGEIGSLTLKRLQEILRQRYQENNLVPRICYPNNPLEINQLYVRIQIIGDDENQADKEAKLQNEPTPQREDYLNHFEDIYGAKDPIELDSLYRISIQPRPTSRYFIEGRAGIGKSILMQYLAYCWSLPSAHSQQLWGDRFQWVFIIRLRNLEAYAATTLSNEQLLLKIVEEECLGCGCENALNHQERQTLHDALFTLKQPTLWCLDGYDEFNSKADARLNQFFNYLMSTTHVVLTSRPNHHLKLDKKITHLEITGFNLEAIHSYINKMYANIQGIEMGRVRHLKDIINQNLNLQGILHVPINLELLCSIWHHNKQLDLSNITITELYKNIVELLIDRYLEKTNQQTIVHVEDLVCFLEALAFLGMKDYRVMLDKDDISKVLYFVNLPINGDQIHLELKRIGLIKPTDNGLHFYFLHLTLQEYFAARYIRKLLLTETTKTLPSSTLLIPSNYIRENKYDPRYQLLWNFLAGQLAQRDMPTEIPLQRFFDWLCQAPFTLPGVHQLNLIIRCLHEAKLSTHIVQKDLILSAYANCLKQLMVAPAIPAGTCRIGNFAQTQRWKLTHFVPSEGIDNPYTDKKPDHLWLEYFLDVLLSCRSIAQSAQMEKIFLSPETYFKCLGRVDFLGEPTMKHLVYGEQMSLPNETWQDVWVDDDFLSAVEKINALANQYHVNAYQNVINIIDNFQTNISDWHIARCAGHLLCQIINENPRVILFLLGAAKICKHKLNPIFSLLNEISANGCYQCENYNVQLLVKLALYIDHVQTTYSLGDESDEVKNLFILWSSLNSKSTIPPECINTFLWSNLNEDLLLKKIDLIQLIGFEAKSPATIDFLLQWLNFYQDNNPATMSEAPPTPTAEPNYTYPNTISSYRKLEIIKILLNWEHYDASVFSQFAQILSVRILGEQQYRPEWVSEDEWEWSPQCIANIIRKLVDARVKEPGFQAVILNFVLNIYRSEVDKKMCFNFVDYLYTILTPAWDRNNLLTQLTRSHHKDISQFAQSLLSILLRSASASFFQSTADSSKITQQDQTTDRLQHIVNQFISGQADAKAIVDYVNSTAMLVYMAGNELCYRSNKRLMCIQLDPLIASNLVQAFKNHSKMPLFITEQDAQQYQTTAPTTASELSPCSLKC